MTGKTHSDASGGPSILLTPPDLSWRGWRETVGPFFRTLVLHGSTAELKNWVSSRQGRTALARFQKRGAELEYAVHVASDLVPRRLLRRRPELFRMNEQGKRMADANLCPSAPDLDELLAERIRPFVTLLQPTNGRYHLWADDNRPWCFCPECRWYAWPDQQLLFINRLARILRAVDPRARISHLAYKPCVEPPVRVRPEPNVFLEFAPIERDYRAPLGADRTTRDAFFARAARDGLAWFGRRDSTVCEYWLDVSMFSRWTRPVRRLDVPPAVLRGDLAFYRDVGFEKVSMFGAWLDASYTRRFGDAPLRQFQAAWRKTWPGAPSKRQRPSRA